MNTKYEVCYQEQFGKPYNSVNCSSFDRAVDVYSLMVRLGYVQVDIYDNEKGIFLLRYDYFRSEREMLEWGLLNNY